MKKMILGVLMVFGVSSYAQAQEQGDFWLGGSLSGYTDVNAAGVRVNTFGIVPEFGYQWHENWGFGIQLGYEYTKEGDVKNNGFVVNPFVRYSFLKGEIANLFVDGSVGYSYNKIKDSDDKTHGVEVGFRPGVAVHVSDNISLIGKVGFLGYRYAKADGYSYNTGGLQLNMGEVQLGVIVRF